MYDSYNSINVKTPPFSLPLITEYTGFCFSLLYSDTGEYTLDSFLRALRRERTEDALSYVSKNYLDRVDLEGLSLLLLRECKLCISYVLKSSYHNTPKNCIAKSFLVMEGGSSLLFNIHMLKEPDRFGKWKIYSIEQEEGFLPYSLCFDYESRSMV